jgi:hypothetical protein
MRNLALWRPGTFFLAVALTLGGHRREKGRLRSGCDGYEVVSDSAHRCRQPERGGWGLLAAPCEGNRLQRPRSRPLGRRVAHHFRSR